MPSWVAGAAALAAAKTGRPVKLRFAARDRHGRDRQAPRLRLSLDGGLRRKGRILALDVTLAARCRLEPRPDAGRGVARADARRQRVLRSRMSAPSATPASTNRQSNTAFRGFGGPQGVLVMEDAIDRIARRLGRDAERDARAQFLSAKEGDETPYGQKVDENHLMRRLGRGQGAWRVGRAGAPRSTPSTRPTRSLKRGLGADAAEVRHLLQHPAHEPGRRAGACLHRRLDPPEPRRYRDGAGAVHQGGAGRGRGVQGRHRAHRPSATSTAEVPNTSPTAASTGSDLNGWAACEAANTLKQRMVALRRRALRRRAHRHRVRRRQRAHCPAP